jgi:hypothetical protein
VEKYANILESQEVMGSEEERNISSPKIYFKMPIDKGHPSQLWSQLHVVNPPTVYVLEAWSSTW